MSEVFPSSQPAPLAGLNHSTSAERADYARPDRPSELNRVIAHLIHEQRAAAQEHSLWVEFLPDGELPSMQFNAELLSQAVTRLLRMAIAYTSKNGVIVMMTAEREYVGEFWVTLTMRIMGDNIRAFHRQYLAERLENDAVGSAASDVGAILVNCRQIMKQLHGRLTIESDSDQDVEFTVWLKPAL
jgi:signal transduction histidine kinase